MYGSQIWGQQNSVVKRLQILQNKALRIMNFQPSRTSATPFFKKCGILKLSDYVNLQNFLFAHDSLNHNLPSSLTGKFSLVATSQNTRSELYLQLNRPSSKTIVYGSQSIRSRSVDIWNYINKHSYQEKLGEKSKSSCKMFVKKFLIGRY